MSMLDKHNLCLPQTEQPESNNKEDAEVDDDESFDGADKKDDRDSES